MRTIIFLSSILTLSFPLILENNDCSEVEFFTDNVYTFQKNNTPSADLGSMNSDITQILNLISVASVYNALTPDGKTLLMYDTGINGFHIYDVSNPEFPTFTTSYPLGSALPVYNASVLISPDSRTAFIAYDDIGTEYLKVADISNPALPTTITTLALYQNTNAFMVSPNTQAMAISSDGQIIFIWSCLTIAYDSATSIMSAINVSNITNPIEISHYSYYNETCSDQNIALSIADDKLFFNDGEFLLVLDISNLEDPSLLSAIHLNISAGLAVSSDGKNAFVLSQQFDNGIPFAALLIFETSNPVSPLNIPLGFDSFTPGSQVLTIFPDDNYIFVAGYDYFMIINITDVQNLTATINSVSTPTSVIISQDGRTAFVTSAFQVAVIELYLDLQMNQVFTLPEDDNYKEIGLEANLTSSDLQMMIMSSDRNVAFMMYSHGYLEIYDISDLTSPKFLGAFNYPNCDSVILSRDETIAFLTCPEEVMLVNITDLTSPTFLTSYNLEFSGFHFDLSLDGKVGFATLDYCLLTVNISNITSPIEINEADSPTGLLAVSFGLSQDTTLGFMLLKNYSDSAFSLLIINTSNVNSMTNVSLLSIGESTAESSVDNPYISISPNNEVLFVTLDINGVDLQIYNISDPISPEQVTWPGINIPASQAVVFSKDSKTAFIATTIELLVVDISTLESPTIIRAYPAPNIVSIILSQDESIAYLGTTFGSLIVITLRPGYAFEMWQREYELGGVYSNPLIPLQINSVGRFNPVSQDYSFVEVSFYNVEAFSYSKDTLTTFPPLPSWIDFDADQETLTVSPVAATQIGSYQIYGALSTVVPNDAFANLSADRNFTSQDLYATLITLGYINTQGFLTSNFNPIISLTLFSQYSDLAPEIRVILLEYYVEITTSISITSSLSFSLSKSISISTKSQNTLSLIIQVSNSQAQFVSNDYAAVAIISNNYSTISMEGSLANINTALRQIIINLNDDDDNDAVGCDGAMTISDGLNPVVNQYITNISQYFVRNQVPGINPNLSIQDEISRTSIYTGQEFMVDLTNTFIDPNGLDLQYSLSMQDNSQQVPGWLMLRGQAIVGTPPEQISDSEIDLIITAKNQFKSFDVRVTLKIRISVLYGLKLVATYGGALITIIGLYIYIHAIYNILCRKRYRYPKDFVIKVGDDRSVHKICTVGFIGKENIASRAVLQELEKTVARELNVKSVSQKEFCTYFIDQGTDSLLEDKLISMIKQEILNLEEKNKFKQDKNLPFKGHLLNEIVQQIVINEVLTMQLNSPAEKVTKNVFNVLKNDWVHLVELGSDPTQFTLNQEELNKKVKAVVDKYNTKFRKDRVFDSNLNRNTLSSPFDESLSIHKKSNKGIDTRPLLAQESGKERRHENLNLDLLEKSIIAVAFRYHNLNVEPIDTKIIMNQKPWKYTLWVNIKKLFKRDLRRIEFVGSGDTGYGMKYEVQKGVLRFFGAPENELKDMTLVVQITNKRGRILRELWINCVAEKSRGPSVS